MTHAASTNDDLALLDDLARAHKQLIAQIGRRIVGQHDVVDNIVAALLSRRTCAPRGRAGAREDAPRAHGRRGARPDVLARAVHARPDAERHHRHGAARGGSRARGSAASSTCAARSSRTSCSPTRSTARHRRRRPRCSRRCRSTRSPRADRRTRCPSRSSCSRRRIRSSRKARIRCPRRSSTASCSSCTMGYPTRRGRGAHRVDDDGRRHALDHAGAHRRPAREAAASRAPAAGAADGGELRGEARALDSPGRPGGDAGRSRST